MIIQVPDEKEAKITSTLQRGKVVSIFEIKPRPYDACKHERATIDESTRSVACSHCKTPLDPFAVLMDFANRERRWIYDHDAWRAMNESRLSDRYDEVWAREHEGLLEPPSDPHLLKIWQFFERYFKGKFVRMYQRRARKRTGVMWYGVSNYGATVSYEYARQAMVPKAQKPEVSA